MERNTYRALLILALVGWLNLNCGGKTAAEGEEENVKVTDFIGYFPEKGLPYELSDTAILRREKDTSKLSYQVFTRFVPDSILRVSFGKGVKPRIYPLARVPSGGAHYLFAKAVSGERKIAYIIHLDENSQYAGAMPILQPDNSTATQQLSGLDRKLQVYKTVIKRLPSGALQEGKDVYIHSADAGNFVLIMTDALDENLREFINPIDTLPRKNKHSADYGTGKQSFVSIRDGRPGRFHFFIHIEKNKGDCLGEIKGEGVYQSASTGIYSFPGDPCSLRFRFSSGSLTLEELKPCGNKRGVKCSFDGSYRKMRAPKSKKKT